MRNTRNFSDYSFQANGSIWSLYSKYSYKLKPIKHHTGYMMVTIAGKKYLIHRVIWEAFNGLIVKGLEINHKDGNKENNCLSNLELVTPSENVRHAFRTGLMTISKGEQIGNSKLKEIDIISIRKLYTNGLKQTEIAKMFGVTQTHVSDIINKKTWKHV